GVYKAQANPSVDACITLLRDKLLAPTRTNSSRSKIAPQVQLGSVEVGSASDLETRIDQPPAEIAIQASDDSALRRVLEKDRIAASLMVQSTDSVSSGVFVKMRSAIAFTGTSDWDVDAVGSAIVRSMRPELTASELGLGWIAKTDYKQ